MTPAVDFFFSARSSPQERRLAAALEDGLAHCSRIEPHDPAPTEPVTLHFLSNAAMPIEQVAVYYTLDGTEPGGERGISDSSAVVQAEAGEVAYNASAGMEVRQWRAVIAGQEDGTLVRYRADGWSQHDPNQHWYVDNADPVSTPPTKGRVFAYNVDRWMAPQWFSDALIYHVFVDRFNAASHEPPLRESGEITGFFGGTLSGVHEKLDYIQALGANCIWLSPIFESPTHHGYDASDYHSVARRLGSNETLRQLVDEVHRRDMHIILDFAPNHTSDQHPLFVEAKNNPESAAAQWYSFGDWPPHGYRSYAQVRHMPELATEQPDVQQYLVDVARYWFDQFSIDGLRLDYVPGPPHAFWTMLQRAIKQARPQALTIGEITSPLIEVADYAGRMDAFMDFSLARALRQVFALRESSLTDLLTFLDERVPLLPPGMGRTTLLDNHDMHRFLWLAGEERARLRLAATCQFTLEGTPIIYYGTEVGLSQYGDAHAENAYARAPMFWDERQDAGLLEHYRRLGVLRQHCPALRYGKRQRVSLELAEAATGESSQVGAYLRYLDSGDFLLIALNNAARPVSITLPVAGELARAGITPAPPAAVRDLLIPADGRTISLHDGALELELPALGATVLQPVP